MNKLCCEQGPSQVGLSYWQEKRAVVVVRRGGPQGHGQVESRVERMVLGYEPSCGWGTGREQVEEQIQPAPLPVKLVVNRGSPIYLIGGQQLIGLSAALGRGVGLGSRTL